MAGGFGVVDYVEVFRFGFLGVRIDVFGLGVRVFSRFFFCFFVW